MEKHHGRHKDQASHHRVYAIGGEVKFLSEWCKEYNMNPSTVRGRMSRGMTLQEALTAEKVDPCASHWSKEREMAKTEKKCAKCRYSQKVENHDKCFYVLYGHGRRPIPASDCADKKPGSVFEPRKRRKLTPAQEIMFHMGG